MSVQLNIGDQIRPKRFAPKQKLQILKEWEASGSGVEGYIRV